MAEHGDQGSPDLSKAQKISVVIPAFGPCPYIHAVVESLRRQTVAVAEIIVSYSGPMSEDNEALNCRLLHSPQRLFAGAARNRGAAQATGDILIFVDADVIPELDLVERLTAHLQPDRFVLGAIGIGRRGGYFGKSNWIVEFSALTSGPPGPMAAPHGASANCCMYRKHFEQAGGFAAKMRAGEDSDLFLRLERKLGLQRWFAGDAEVAHMNISGVGNLWRHQVRCGRFAARYRRQFGNYWYMENPWRFFAAAVFFVRLLLVARRALVYRWRNLLYLPGIALGIFAWAVGFAEGALRRTESLPARGRRQLVDTSH